MKNSIKTIDLKQIFIFVSSVLMIPGVFLKLIQINVKMSFFGMSMDESFTTSYWQNGNGDGKYIIALAFLTVIILFIRNYKLIWISFFSYLGIIIYSLMNLVSDALSVGNNPIAKQVLKSVNPDYSIYPREGAILILLGLVFILLAAVIKNRDVIIFDKKPKSFPIVNEEVMQEKESEIMDKIMDEPEL